MIDNKNPRILIATGIYPPEIGGPAGYAKNLAEKLELSGSSVCIITYSDERNYEIDKNLSYKLIRIKRTNKISNYLRYFIAIVKNIKNFDIVYAFDYISAGIPSVLACKIFNKKLTIRSGGDFIWESYLDKYKKGIKLKDFYKLKLYRKFFLKFFVSKIVLKLCDAIIFTTKFQEQIFERPYNINTKKVFYISNPVIINDSIEMKDNRKNNILFAGRIIEKANLLNAIKAFSKINQEKFNFIILGDGNQKYFLKKYDKDNNIENIIFEEGVLNMKLRMKIAESYAMIFPSYTDISPNTVLDCISMKKPFILTTEHGFDWLKGIVPEFNPLSLDEIKHSIENIMDEKFYETVKLRIAEINYKYSYDDVMNDTLEIFEKVL